MMTTFLHVMSEVEPWFDPNRFGAIYGSSVGVLGGLFGATIGGLAGTMVKQGKGRKLVLGLMWGMFALGLANVAFCGIALACGQPYGIWYGAAVGGGVMTMLPLFLIPVLRKQYAIAELRKMEASDLRHDVS